MDYTESPYQRQWVHPKLDKLYNPSQSFPIAAVAIKAINYDNYSELFTKKEIL